MCDSQNLRQTHQDVFNFLDAETEAELENPDENDENLLTTYENRKRGDGVVPTKKGSISMLRSLRKIQKSLDCPLCENILVEPVTIPCGHTFCCSCIDSHVDDSWYCPIKSCSMPVSMKGSRRGTRFRQINPSIETVVNSWTIICRTIMNAEDYWWQNKDTEEEDEKLDASNDEHENDVDPDVEEVVDLQAMHITDVLPDIENDDDSRSESESYLTADH